MSRRVLIIGGTGFIGRHLVSTCLDHNHDVAVLNRNRRPAPPLDAAMRIVADRRHPSVAALAAAGAGWDTVIDTCAFAEEDMTICESIPTRRYVLLSSCGVYQTSHSAVVVDERAPLDPGGSARGKLDCERMAHRLAAEVLVVRLGAVTGPGDDSGRLTYWIERCQRGDDVLVPAERAQPLQLVDVRDVVTFLAAVVDSTLRGVVNVAGTTVTFEELLSLVKAATDRRSRLRWIPEQVVLDHGVVPWREIPLWLPTGHPYRGHMRIASPRAEAAGLAMRPLATTIEDTALWYREHRAWHPDWLPIDREQAILRERGEPG